MASFQAKIVWKRPRKRENENNSLVLFLPDALQKIKKKQQRNSKNQKRPLWLQCQPKQDGKCREGEKIKIIVSFRPNLKDN